MRGRALQRRRSDALGLVAVTPVDLKRVGQGDVDREILRLGMIAELDAVNLYEQMAARARNSRVKKVLLDIAKEEKTHVGEFQAVLSDLDPEYVRELRAGRREVGGLEAFSFRRPSLPVVVGGVVALGVLVVLLRPKGGSEVDALARMLLAETTLKSSESEMAQIVFIAVNRAKKWGIPVTQVVNPTGYRKGEAWSVGPTYKSRFERAHTWAKWEEAKAFVRRVLGGAYPNRGYVCFVHPAGMPEPPCAANRVEADTIAGRRCVTNCTARGTTIGKGLFA